MPAGTQFLGELLESTPRDWPRGIQVAASVERNGTSVIVGVKPGRAVAPSTLAGVRTGDGPWKVSTIDTQKGYRLPKGFPSRRGFFPVAITAGAHGFVALGPGQFWDSALNYAVTVESVIWHSKDGVRWTRFDPRTIIAGDIALLLRAAIVTPDGGFVVTGSVGSRDLTKPSRVIVLTSGDGVKWRLTATLDARWALDASSLSVVGDQLLLQAVEYACDGTSSFMASYSVAAQTRLWHAGFDATAWTAIPTDGLTMFTPPRPVPQRPSGCPPGLQERDDRFATDGRILGVVGDRLVAVDPTAGTIAVSADLATWSVADLPGFVYSDPSATRDVRSTTVLTDVDGSLVVLSLQTRRNAEDRPAGFGWQVLSWRSGDGGATWQRLPATRPLLETGRFGSLSPQPDGTVVLDDEPASSAPGSRLRLLVSRPGPFVPWDTCTPGPHAECQFTTLMESSIPGADLAGIDLAGATIRGGDWSGVSLDGANLDYLDIDAPMTGADLTDGQANWARFTGDMTGAIVTGARFHAATLPLSVILGDTQAADVSGAYLTIPGQMPLGLDLRDRDLRDLWLVSYAKDGDLKGIDFAGAQLDGTTFWGVDLSGASFTGAQWGSLTFFSTTCPDGEPSTQDVYDATACRLKVKQGRSPTR